MSRSPEARDANADTFVIGTKPATPSLFNRARSVSGPDDAFEVRADLGAVAEESFGARSRHEAQDDDVLEARARGPQPDQNDDTVQTQNKTRLQVLVEQLEKHCAKRFQSAANSTTTLSKKKKGVAHFFRTHADGIEIDEKAMSVTNAKIKVPYVDKNDASRRAWLEIEDGYKCGSNKELFISLKATHGDMFSVEERLRLETTALVSSIYPDQLDFSKKPVCFSDNVEGKRFPEITEIPRSWIKHYGGVDKVKEAISKHAKAMGFDGDVKFTAKAEKQATAYAERVTTSQAHAKAQPSMEDKAQSQEQAERERQRQEQIKLNEVAAENARRAASARKMS